MLSHLTPTPHNQIFMRLHLSNWKKKKKKAIWHFPECFSNITFHLIKHLLLPPKKIQYCFFSLVGIILVSYCSHLPASRSVFSNIDIESIKCFLQKHVKTHLSIDIYNLYGRAFRFIGLSLIQNKQHLENNLI